MVKINFDDLKEVLPVILKYWIDKDDESWEWIFNEIEQRCRIDKKKKKKSNSHLDDVVEKQIDECNRKITNLSDVYTGKVKQMQLTINDLRAEIEHLRSEIKATKSMAETAKRRTEVDYSKYSGKSDGKISYCNPEDKDCKNCKYYCDTEIIKEPCFTCNAYEHWEAKENG